MDETKEVARKFKVGDRVRVIQSSGRQPGNIGCIAMNENKWFRSYKVVFDNHAVPCWFDVDELEIITIVDKYLIEGFYGLFDTYEAAEARAREEAADTSDPIAIARVVAYAKPTINIIVEEV
jgi:hypothetical protein